MKTLMMFKRKLKTYGCLNRYFQKESNKKMTSYMLGVDIGTTSTKAVLFTKKGDVIQQENIGYPLYTPDMTTAEQDPEEIFQAILKAVSNITKQHSDKKLSFISFSSAMHSVIAMDENDQPLTP